MTRKLHVLFNPPKNGIFKRPNSCEMSSYLKSINLQFGRHAKVVSAGCFTMLPVQGEVMFFRIWGSELIARSKLKSALRTMRDTPKVITVMPIVLLLT